MDLFKKITAVMGAAAISLSAVTVTSSAKIYMETPANINYTIYSDHYVNWEGVSNVDQFKDENGNFCFAYDDGNYVEIVKTDIDGNILPQRIRLEKKHPMFGTVICDNNGNFYLVTGEKNNTDDMSVETVFVSKYDKYGNYITSVGDNGNYGDPFYYDPNNDFAAKEPFHSGNCSAAINGNLLAVHYAKLMYSGHQACGFLAIYIDTMEKADIKGGVYQSHSFAQRVLPYGDGFILAGEGDAYDRAFTIWNVQLSDGRIRVAENNVFHFWGALGANNNFADLANITAVGNHIILIGTSAPSLNSNAQYERKQLFVQVFDYRTGPGLETSYYTSGTRTGTCEGVNVTDYGVKWLTNFSTETISDPQAIADDSGNVIILYRLTGYTDGKPISGIYYMVIDAYGNVVKDQTLVSETADLNDYRMPVVINGRIYFMGNNSAGKLYVNVLDPFRSLAGDLNDNGKLDADDIPAMTKILAGTPNDNGISGDVNGDGHFDIRDLSALIYKVNENKNS